MKKVVVIGGGFAGATVAKKLKSKCDLTLIDTEDFFEYTPGILRVLVEPEHYDKLHVKHIDYLPRVNVVVGHVKGISKNYVSLTNGRKIKYDYLIIASGSSYNEPIKEEDTFFAIRVKHLLEAHKKIQKSNRICVVGGGVVGVELAAELATHYKNKKICLIHSHSRLIEKNNIKTSKYVKKFLEKHNVDLIFNERIINKSGKKLISNSGKKYDYDSVFFTVGIRQNVEFMKKGFSKVVSIGKGIKVNEYLQLLDRKNIFVAGDVSNIAEEKTAQNAEKHGKLVAHNLDALINNRNMKSYKSKKRLMVISLGKYCGIMEHKNFILTGIIPAMLKSFIEKMVMFSFRR
jgi:apoptosis-inducing factor 2